jgi:hypothetical protein
MRSFMEDHSVIIQSERLLAELRVFIWRNGKAQALNGYNDDLAMAWGIGLFLRDTALRFRQTAYNLTYASLNSYSRGSQGFDVYQSNAAYTQNPYSMPLNDREQTDITWLL